MKCLRSDVALHDLYFQVEWLAFHLFPTNVISIFRHDHVLKFLIERVLQELPDHVSTEIPQLRRNGVEERERELDKERTSNAGHFLLAAERIGVDLESRQRALLQRGTNFEIQFVRIGIFSEASQQALQLGAEAIRRKR